MKQDVYFRVDANSRIGLGHAMRCIALAQMLQGEFNIVFFCRELPESLQIILKGSNIKLHRISAESEFLSSVRTGSIVVLDGYDFDIIYQQELRSLGCKLVCIDDLHDKEFFADLIINHAPGVGPSDYKAQPYARLALGPEYALLRPAFLLKAKKSRKIERVESVLICFGGTDNNNLTERTLSLVLASHKFKQINVITGSEFSHLDSLKIMLKENEIVTHYHMLDEQELSSLMWASDLAIVPASVILFEALALGCKVISGYYVDNQMEIYRGFLELNAFVDAGNFDSERVINSLGMIDKHSTIRIFDGNSAGRVLNCFKNLSNAGSNIS